MENTPKSQNQKPKPKTQEFLRMTENCSDRPSGDSHGRSGSSTRVTDRFSDEHFGIPQQKMLAKWKSICLTKRAYFNNCDQRIFSSRKRKACSKPKPKSKKIFKLQGYAIWLLFFALAFWWIQASSFIFAEVARTSAHKTWRVVKNCLSIFRAVFFKFLLS